MLNERFLSTDKPKLSWGKEFENLCEQDMYKIIEKRWYERLGLNSLEERLEIHPLLIFLREAPYRPPHDLVQKHLKQGDWQEWVDSFSGQFRDYAKDECRLAIYLDKYHKLPPTKLTEKQKILIEQLNNIVKEDLNKKLLKNINENSEQILERPTPKSEQIWLTKNELDGVLQTHDPYFVMITGISGDSNLVRVSPISRFTNFAAEGDVLIKSPEMGSFMIEEWNEQPLFVSQLDKYIYTPTQSEFETGKILVEDNQIESEEDISEFRYLEIENTRYLRSQPLASLFQDEDYDFIEDDEHYLREPDEVDLWIYGNLQCPELTQEVDIFDCGIGQEIFFRTVVKGDWEEWLSTINDSQERNKLKRLCLILLEDQEKIADFSDKVQERYNTYMQVTDHTNWKSWLDAITDPQERGKKERMCPELIEFKKSIDEIIYTDEEKYEFHELIMKEFDSNIFPVFEFGDDPSKEEVLVIKNVNLNTWKEYMNTIADKSERERFEKNCLEWIRYGKSLEFLIAKSGVKKAEFMAKILSSRN